MLLKNIVAKWLPIVLPVFFSALFFENVHGLPDNDSGLVLSGNTLVQPVAELISYGDSNTEPEGESDEDYYDFVENWHRNRIEVLKEDKGWLRLVGIHWLNEGEQSFGSGEQVRIRFPEGSIPEFAGIFKLEADTVTMKVVGNIDIRDQDGRRIQDHVIFTPESRRELHYRRLTWFVARHDNDELGIRMYDDNSPYLTHFDGIDRYDVDKKWRIEADFTPGEEGASMKIENVLGQMVEWDVAGTLSFTMNGKVVEILALGTGDRLFIPFADATSGIETYAIGRYVYIDRPEAGEPAIIDFNVSYNPPCAINPYTSCPLPPQQNRLDFPIRAGEKNFEMYSEDD